MDGHKAEAKRLCVNSSSAVRSQNPTCSRKKAQILDDTWLEALKHLTCPQWSLMSLISRQVNGVIQRNLSRLPPLLMESAHSNLHVIIFSSYQRLKDEIVNTEGGNIRCHSFILDRCGDETGMGSNTYPLSSSLKWLEQNVRSDSISLPEWVSYRVHEKVRARRILSNFIFGTSQNCKVKKLIFTRCDYLMEFINNLIEDFLAFPVNQGIIPTVIIDRYPEQEEYRAHLGENLIGQEVDSQGAHALYEIENGDKRIRISFCREHFVLSRGKAYLKFYTG